VRAERLQLKKESFRKFYKERERETLIYMKKYILFCLCFMLVTGMFGVVFSETTNSTTSASISPPFYIISWAVTSSGITINLKNNGDDNLEIQSVVITNCGNSFGEIEIYSGGSITEKVDCDLSNNEGFYGNIVITYKKIGSSVDLTSTGSISDRVDDYNYELTCTDSDGGQKYNIKGTLASPNIVGKDSCVGNLGDGYKLVEYYCSNDETGKSIEYDCPLSCKDGRCNAEEDCVEKSQTICKDSDIYWLDSCGRIGDLEEDCESGCSEIMYGDDECIKAIDSSKECAAGMKWSEINGNCFANCRDTDEGEDYYVAEDIILEEGGDRPYKISDKCYDNEWLGEWICIGDGGYEEKKIRCEEGCENNACIKTKTEIIEPEENQDHLEIPENTQETTFICKGCKLENKCYAEGYRKGEDYCSDSYTFIEQKEADLYCESNFECESNICMDNTCISNSLIQKIINFFKNLFS